MDREHIGQNRTQTAVRREQRNATTEEVDPDHEAAIDSRRMTRGNNPREIESDDLLIGEGGSDTLRAHRGDDILIGGAGRDRMEGGIGRDTYVVGNGDIVMDSDGRGELRWNGRALGGGTRGPNDPENTYRSDDGNETYVINDSTLTVTNRHGESLQVENYARNDLGLRLQDPPARARDDATDEREAGVDRLSAQDRAVYDRILGALNQNIGRYSQEQRENIAAAGLFEFKRRESVVQQAQDVGVYGDRLFVAYFPHGRDREPNFHANVRLDDVANLPALESLRQAEALARERAVAVPERHQGQEQDQRAPGIGARGL